MYTKNRIMPLVVLMLAILNTSLAQTDEDAIMMSKNNLCSGIMYGHSSWNNYWEGTLKRDNQNLGTVSSNMFSIMENYGVNRKLNIIANLPYNKSFRRNTAWNEGFTGPFGMG